MLRRIRQLLEMIRFSHTLFALPFALLAAAMAWAANRRRPPLPFRWRDLLGILVCMAAARSAAMAFNRLADRRLDALNPRTRTRHLPTGALSVAAVAAFTVVCVAGFRGRHALVSAAQPDSACTPRVPVLAFLFGYSYAKRFTVLSHFWLGAALMLAPLAAWVAIRGELAWPPLVLGGAVLLWVAGFDMIYACQDVEFDVTMRLRSVPARFGVAARPAAGRRLPPRHGRCCWPPCRWSTPRFGSIYLAGVAAMAALLLYEHWLVRPDDLSRVNRAFFQVNAVVSLGLLAVGTLDLLL